MPDMHCVTQIAHESGNISGLISRVYGWPCCTFANLGVDVGMFPMLSCLSGAKVRVD